MTTLFKRLAVLFCLSALLALAVTGCNTAHGFGKDVSRTGDAIQRGTD
jgi:predicted small secreted protein